MSLTTVPAARRAGVPVPVPAVPSSAPAPRALIDYDFQTVLRVPPKRRLVLWLMLGLIAAAAVGLWLLKVDIVVSANGKIVTSDSEIVIQPVETSVVRSIAVKMGQQVKAGEVLATLDPTFSQADRDELGAKLRTLKATFDRLDAEFAGRAYDPPNPNPDEQTQREIFRRRHDEYAAKLDAAVRKAAQYKADLAAHKIEAKNLDEQIRLASQAEAMYQQLVAKDLASKLKLIEASQRRVDATTRLDTNLGEQQRLAEQIAGAEAERDGFVQEWRRKLSEEMAQTRSDRDAAVARLSKAERRHTLAVMIAPVDATVLEVAHRPAGSVLREAETLMRLVPADDKLLVEVQIDTRDVARLHIGDRATIKLEALPWQQYRPRLRPIEGADPGHPQRRQCPRNRRGSLFARAQGAGQAEPDPLPRPHRIGGTEVPQPARRLCVAAGNARRLRHQGRPPLDPRLRDEPDHPRNRRKPPRTVSRIVLQDNLGGVGVTTYFCDGLKEVTVVNGVVRLEFHRLEAVQRGANRELQPVSEFTLALPVQGFMQALGVLENVRDRFAEQGLITPGESAAPPPQPAKSPNFS